MAITDYVDVPNTGSDLAKNAPLVSQGKAIVKAASSGEIGTLSADVGTFAMGALTVAADPLNALISAGLGFLEDWCTPVKNCLAQVTGKPEELDKNKEAFGEVAKDLNKLSGELQQITTNGFQNWSGDAKDAASHAVDTFIQGVDGTTNNATDIASILGISATLMDAAKEIINGILSTLIEWLIVTWVAALAASFFTFGASDAAATAATGVEVSVEGANAADKVEETGSLIERIVNIIKNIVEKLKSFGKEVKNNHALLKDGKDVVGKDAGKAGEDGAADATGDAAHAGEGTTPSESNAPTDGGKPPTDGGKPPADGGKPPADSGKPPADSGNAPADGGNAPSEGESPSGESSGSNDKPNFFQNKWNEAKDGVKDPMGKLQETNSAARDAGNPFSYLTTPRGEGPSPLADTLMDAGVTGGAKIYGTLVDNGSEQENGPDGWGSQSGTIDQDLQG